MVKEMQRAEKWRNKKLCDLSLIIASKLRRHPSMQDGQNILSAGPQLQYKEERP